jgi:hypothetical protein
MWISDTSMADNLEQLVVQVHNPDIHCKAGPDILKDYLDIQMVDPDIQQPVLDNCPDNRPVGPQDMVH